MKNILGHKSLNRDEIVKILIKTGSYTCPTLPHYRYNRVQTICRDLIKRGFLKKSGKTDVSINLVVTDRFREWHDEYTSKKTSLMPVKWQKKKYPAAPLPPNFKKVCHNCNIQFNPSQKNQKFCSKRCRAESKINGGENA